MRNISRSHQKDSTNKRDAKRGWTEQEDQKLIDYIKIHGEGRWSTVPKAAGLKRRGKSCRHRWIKYLRPDLRHANFCFDEEDLIIKLHALLGDRWSLIAGRLPGRTDEEVKKYWNSHIKRKLQNAGIDPHNHRVDQSLMLTTTTHAAKPRVYEKETSENLSRSISSSGSTEDDDELAGHGSSTQVNLDLTMAVPASSSSSSRFVVAEQKKQEESEIAEARDNKDKPALLLFR